MIAIADIPALVSQFTSLSAKLGYLMYGQPATIPTARRRGTGVQESPVPRKKRRSTSMSLPARPPAVQPSPKSGSSIAPTRWILGPLEDLNLVEDPLVPEATPVPVRQHLLMSGDGGQLSKRKDKTVLTYVASLKFDNDLAKLDLDSVHFTQFQITPRKMSSVWLLSIFRSPVMPLLSYSTRSGLI